MPWLLMLFVFVTIRCVAAQEKIKPSAPIWPNATNTGYGNRSLVNASSGTITSPGIYDGLNFGTGGLSIGSSNVTVTNCYVELPTNANFAVSIDAGLTNVVIQNCTIRGDQPNSGNSNTYGIYIRGNSQVTIDACNIYGTSESVQVSGSTSSSGSWPVEIKNSYFHDIAGPPGSHFEAVAYSGGAGAGWSLNIHDNNIYNQNNQTAGIFIENYFGAVTDITINHNLVGGGNYSIQIDGQQSTNNMAHITVTNNFMIRGQFGYWDLNRGKAVVYQVTHSGNVDYRTGTRVDR
jgi:hypothetical protein